MTRRIISTELLQALMGGSNDDTHSSNDDDDTQTSSAKSRHLEAQAYWQSLSPNETCCGLLLFLQEQSAAVALGRMGLDVLVSASASASKSGSICTGTGTYSATGTTGSAALVPLELAAILLRRTLRMRPTPILLTLTAASHQDATSTTTTSRPFGMELVATLRQLRCQLLLCGSDAPVRRVTHALEHCLAEICALALTLTSEETRHAGSISSNSSSTTTTAAAATTTATRENQQLVHSLLTHAPVTCSLWTAVAERAPHAFYHSGVWRRPDDSLPRPDNDTDHAMALASTLRCLVAAATAVQHGSRTSGGVSDTDQSMDGANWEQRPPLAPAAAEVAAMGSHHLVPLLPRILGVCRQSSPNNQTVTNIWSHLIQIAEDVPDLLSQCRIEMLHLCQECLEMIGLSVVQTVVALLSSFRRCCSQPFDWKNNDYCVSSLVHGSIQTCWKTLLGDESTNQTDADWSTATEPASLYDSDTINYASEDDDDIDDCQHAELLLSQLLRISPDTGLAAVLLPRVSDALSTAPFQSSPPRTTCVALSTLSCAVEAIPVAMTPHMVTVVSAALAMANRGAIASSLAAAAAVHWHAVRLLGVVCESPIMASPHSQLDESHWTAMVTQLIQSIGHGSTKVAALACQAMVSYSRLCLSNSAALTVLTFHVPNFVHALVSGQGPLNSQYHGGHDGSCTTGHVVVQIRAVGSVACVAQVVGPAAWTPYYSTVMPCLWALATRTGNVGLTYERAQLAGSSLEAATMIGQAVSLTLDNDTTRNTQFVSDAHQIMPWILAALEQQSDTGLPRDLLWAACARIASVLQEAYAPYVDHVVPHLLRQAMDAVDVEISEGDVSGLDTATTRRPQVEVDEDQGTESMTMEVPGKGWTKVTINTTKIQEKAQATRAVYEHAVALPECFGPYCQPCFNAFMPLVEYKFSSEIRATAAQTLAAVFEAACRSGLEIAPVYLPPLLTMIARQMNEEDVDHVEVLHTLAVTLSDICQSVNAYRFDGQGREMVGYLSEVDVKAVVQRCVQAMVACLKRRDDITSALASGEGLSGEDERNELERNLMGEQELLTPLVDSIGYLLKCFGPRFTPIFNEYVAPTLGPYLGSGLDVRARLSAVCLFDDCVEHCGAEAAAKFGPHLLVGILEGWNQSDDAELQRSAIYGVAQLARHAPASILAPHAREMAQGLLYMVRTTANRDFEDNERAIYENALSALTSLTLFENAPFRTAGLVDQVTVADYFFQSLPLREDEDEAQICHAELCSLLEQGYKLPHLKSDELLRILNEILSLVNDGEEIAAPETCHRLQLILHKMQPSPTSTMEGVDSSSSAGFVHLG